MDLTCRDVTEALWWHWSQKEVALVDRDGIRSWADAPKDRRGDPWPGGPRQCHNNPAGDDGWHIYHATHCAQEKRSRGPSEQVAVVVWPRPQDGQPREGWIIRWKKDEAQSAPVYFSLDPAECADAAEEAEAEATRLDLKLKGQAAGGWRDLAWADRKCPHCRSRRGQP
jgi:hypothetical protein